MKRQTALLVAAHLLVGCSAPEPGEATAIASVRSAILGGNVDVERAAVMALWESLDQSYGLCTATVIHVANRSALLLTAAHCVVATNANGDIELPPEPLPPSELQVTPSDDAGRDLLLERQYPVVSVALAPGYNGIFGNPNDLALVRIVGATEDLPRSALLSPEDAALAAAEAVTLVGFGQSTDPEDKGRRRWTTQSIAWLNEQFVGFDQRNGRGLCKGDSGGPVLVKRDGAEKIAAVNSLATGTAEAPCVYNGTSVQTMRHAAFIAQAIAALPATLDCESCIRAEQAPGNACAPATTCDGECGELLACLDACENHSCASACGAVHASGLAQYRAARAKSGSCASTRCSAACQVGEGGATQGAAGAGGEASSGAASGGAGGTEAAPPTDPQPLPVERSAGCSLSAPGPPAGHSWFSMWLVPLYLLRRARAAHLLKRNRGAPLFRRLVAPLRPPNF